MIVLENLTKTYKSPCGKVKALSGIGMLVEKGEFIALCGPSGSGKTTLLMTIAAMLRPTSGTVQIDQKNLYKMSVQERAKFRACTIGFVFQMFHLVPYLNVIENVALVGGVTGVKDAGARARQLVDQLGISHRAFHKPAELSAGEKQRTAIARALLNRPKIILADEPTGNLDPENASSVLEHLSAFRHAGGTVILATHGAQAEDFADRIVNLRNGKLQGRQ